MALLGTGANSNLTLPEADDHYRELEDAAKSNQPNRAIYHLVTIVEELRDKVAELEEKLESKSSAKKSTPRKSTKKTDDSESNED